MSASDLLMEIMVQQGIPEDKAQMIADRIMIIGLLPPKRAEVLKRHLRIEALSRQGVSSADIASRLDMHRCSVSKIISSIHMARKAK